MVANTTAEHTVRITGIEKRENMDWFCNQSPVLQGLQATSFTYFVTILGAAVVFVFKSVNRRVMDIMMGFSAGVMIAASYWSLLEPAITLAEELGENAAVIAAAGFFSGGFFIICSDILLEKKNASGNRKAGWKRCMLLTTAVTLHNIPEGLAVGVAFGSAGLNGKEEYLLSAIMLAAGIAIQNFPEGTCVAMPLRREGVSRKKSFLAGQFSGMVEPIAGVLGAMFALKVQSALPIALSFSAGAMIAVVCSELIPESFRDNKQLASFGVLAGFVVMMVLDVAFG